MNESSSTQTPSEKEPNFLKILIHVVAHLIKSYPKLVDNFIINYILCNSFILASKILITCGSTSINKVLVKSNPSFPFIEINWWIT